MPKGALMNITMGIQDSFQFEVPKGGRFTDIFKGWYARAQKVSMRLPRIYEVNGPGEAYQYILRDHEVTKEYIKYVVVNRDNLQDEYVIVLRRRDDLLN